MAKACVQAARALCVLAIVGLSLVLAPVAGATVSSFTWTGDAAEPSWSAAKNWKGEIAPSSSGPIALDFPRIPSCAGACYKSTNDVSGLDVESIGIDDGDEYVLEGDEITLGSGGLMASPAITGGGEAGDHIDLPIRLGSSQTWSVAGRSGGRLGEHGVIVSGGVTGLGRELKVNLSDKPLLGFAGDTEVGPVVITGTSAGAGGGVVLSSGKLNGTDGSPVSLSDVGFEGDGTVGALKASAAELAPVGRFEASSATFDASSKIIFGVAGAYNSELMSQGSIELGGSSIELITSGPSRQSCPSLKNGEVHTLISTTGTLSGSFSNAPQGEKIVAEYPTGCLKIPFYLEIAYHESGATKTVTAKVIETDGFELPLPPKYYEPYERPNAEGATWGAIAAARDIAEAKAREKEAAEARARALVETSAGGVSLASTSVAVQSDGVALVKLHCKGGASCAGKLALSTQATSRAKGKRKRTITLGTAKFSIAAGQTATVKVKLDVAGRGLLNAAHERLAARLAILVLAPGSGRTQTTGVHLVGQKSHGKTGQ